MNTMHEKSNKILLLPENEHCISFKDLPAGRYIYYFSINNPEGKAYELKLQSQTGNFSIKDSQKSIKRHLEFTIVDGMENSIRFNFNLKYGKNVFLVPSRLPHLSISDQLNGQHIHHFNDAELNGLFINDRQERVLLKENLKPIDVYLKVFSELQHHNKVTPSIKSTDSFFYELIDLEAAKKQLEYVVYEKMLKSTDGNLLKKGIKKLIRAFLIIFYKLVTKSESRKTYIAKFYRNYVNLNYMSERKRL